MTSSRNTGDNSWESAIRRILFAFLALSPVFLSAQGEFNKWYFGYLAGIDFNSTPPSALPASAMNTMYASVSVADSLGNLLFYSQGLSVYNRNHQIMPNGNGLLGDQLVQGVFTVRKPGEDNLYYLFTIYNNLFPVAYGLYYSLIDMNLNGGMGDVVPGEKNTPLSGAEDVFCGIHGTRHLNNRDAWIVVRKFNTNQYASYRITSSGISATPVLSSCSLPICEGFYCGNNVMKISQDGTMYVFVSRDPVQNFDIAELGMFNSQTGVLTPLFQFRPVNVVPENPQYFEYSPNSKLLYTVSSFTTDNRLVFQYNLTFSDSAQFMQSQIMLASPYHGSALQLGPDGKIYQSIGNVDSLNVINNPNVQGFGCNFQSNAIDLASGTFNHYGLPQFLQRYKAYIHHTGDCPHDPVNFTSDIWPPDDSIRWNFGDPASGAANFSIVANPAHNYSSPGNYTVELYVRHNDNRTDTTWQTITIQPAPQPTLGPDQTICTPQTATFDAGACTGCTYQWDDITNMIMNIGSGQTYTTGIPGIYRVTVFSQNGCYGRDTIQLSIAAPSVLSVTVTAPPGTICAGNAAIFMAITINGGTTPAYQWKVNGINAINATNASYAYNASNGDLVSCIVTSSDPCVSNNPASSIPYPVSVSPLLPVSVTVSASANPVCAGASVTFLANANNAGSLPGYQWKVNGINANNATNASYAYNANNGDLVTCVLTSSETCTSGNPATSAPVSMIVHALPIVTGTATPSASACEGNAVTLIGNGALTYTWNNGVMNGVAFIPFATSTYTVTGTDVNGCSNTAQIVVTVNSLPVVGASATASQVCAGSPVTLTGSGALSYVWSNGVLNGVPFIPMATNTYAVTGTDANGCSNTAQVTVTVTPLLPVSVTIAASANPFCLGSPVTFTANANNAGSSPTYQWKVNGINAGNATNASYAYNAVNGDVVICVLTSSETCTSGNPAISNAIIMIVNSNLPAGITIAASANPFCPGTSVTFTATPANGGATPSYQWKVNAANAGINSSVFIYTPVSGDLVSCILTSNLNCVTSNPATSPTITMTERAAPVVSFTNCFDTITILGAKPYQLKGGLPTGGQYTGPGVNTSTGIFTPTLAGTGLKTITYSYSNVYTCMASKTKTILVQSNPVFICGNNLTDIRDNKVYTTVQLGTQCWMSSNLDFGFTISDLIPQTDNCTPEKYCYNDNPVNCTNNGGLYQWDEMMKYDNTQAGQGLCPPGWHVPTENDWITLFNFYQGNGLAGRPLQDSIINGFNAKRSGVYYLNSSWKFMDFATLFWSSTSWGQFKALSHGMNTYNFSVSIYQASRANSFSVRCLRD
jgi:uncharacterized protein (TIGR02145 family)